MEQRSWTTGTCHHYAEFLVSDERCLNVYARVSVYVFVYSCIWVACFFFPTTATPGVSPSTEGMLFLTGGGPHGRAFFPLSPLRASVFPAFFSLFFTGAPIIRRSAFASVSYSFSTDRGRPLLLTAPASTLFHLIKGHKLPYDDGGKKRGKEKKRTYCPQIARLAFSPVVFLAGGP